jgi:hypothetical protein
MRASKLTFGILLWLVTLVILPASQGAADENDKKKEKGTVEPQKKEGDASIAKPIYKPPLRGTPLGRVGGANRGTGSETPIVIALVPDHTGLTLREQPSLYWYSSKATNHHAEFTLIDNESIEPLVQKRIGPPVEAGFHPVHLKDSAFRLSKGKQYKWYVAIVLDPDHRSKDITAGGLIEYIQTPPELQARLNQVPKAEYPNVLADAGIWYDTLSSVNELIDSAPDDPAFRENRVFLLRQVGLFLESE